LKRTTSTCTAAGLAAVILSGSAVAEPQDSVASRFLEATRQVKPLTELALAPDGRRLVYGSALGTERGGAEVEVSTLWLIDAHDGSGLTRLTACPGTVCDEHGAAWSNDGRRIVFVTTDAHEQTQIAVASADGRDVHVITHAQGPVDAPRFSPDGAHIAFLYAKGAPRTPGPLNPLARASGVMGSSVYEQRLTVVGPDGGEERMLGPDDLYVYEYDWAPDGQRFVVSAAHGSGDDNWWLAELALIDTASGGLTPLAKPGTQIASPRFSGDGTRIAYIGGIMSDEGVTGGDVYVLPASSGATPEDVTPGLAASVQTITWNGSKSRLVATEFMAGEEVLASIDVEAKRQRELWHGAQMIWASSLDGMVPGTEGIALSRTGNWSAVIRQSYTSPPEVETGPPGWWHAITHLNAHVRPLTGKAVQVNWMSDGQRVQGMLIEPPAVVAARRYPLIVKVHGGPAYAAYPIYPSSPGDVDAAFAAAGYFVLKPNPRGSYGQGAAFTRANVRDFGYGDLRDILLGVDEVERTAPIDPARVGIEGWSYGGFMTMWAITQTDRFKAAAAGAGLSDWLSYYGTNDIDTWMLPYFGASVYDDPKIYERSSPLTFIKNAHTPTLIVAGDRDAEVPISQSYEFWNALRRLGVPTEFVVYPDEGHHFYKRADQADVLTRMLGWFDHYLGAGESAAGVEPPPGVAPGKEAAP
jgi:dipeptidyl aminopeptidase/acylaminoacyl peptidase